MFILAIVTVFLIMCIFYIFYLKFQMNKIRIQLDDISARKSTHKIEVSLFDKDIEKLAGSINRNIDFQRKLRIDVLNNEENLKESIANISHDLRTPLTAISGHLQLMDKSNLTCKQRDKINIISKKAKVMQKLINSFFEICVIENDKSPLKLEKINLNNFMSEILLQNINIFEKSNLNPEFDICENTIIIKCDKLILERIIQNLISNMIKYSKGYCKISLKKLNGEAENKREDIESYKLESSKKNKRSYKSKSSEANNIRADKFKISQSNIEICQEHKKENIEIIFENEIDDPENIDVNCIFNKFYTADKSRTCGSTGLGLSIVKLLAQKINAEAEASINNKILSIKITI